MLVRLQLGGVRQIQQQLPPRLLEGVGRVGSRRFHSRQNHLHELGHVLVEAAEGHAEAVVLRVDGEGEAAHLQGVGGLLQKAVHDPRMHGCEDGVLDVLQHRAGEADLHVDDGLRQLHAAPAKPPALGPGLLHEPLRSILTCAFADQVELRRHIRQHRRWSETKTGRALQLGDKRGINGCLAVVEIVVRLVRRALGLVELWCHQGHVHVRGHQVVQHHLDQALVRLVDEHAAREHVFRSHAAQGARQRADRVVLRRLVLLVIEHHLAQALDAVHELLVDSCTLHGRHVGEEIREHRVRVGKTLLRQREDQEDHRTRHGVLRIVRVMRREVFLEEQGLQAPRAIMAEDIPDVRFAELLVLLLESWHRKRHPQLWGSLRVDHEGPPDVSELLAVQRELRVLRARRAALRRGCGNGVEVLVGHGQLLLDGVVADDYKVHPARTIIILVKCAERFHQALAVAFRLGLERLQVSGGELVHRVQRVGSRPQEMPKATLCVRLVFLVLRVYSMDLLVNHAHVKGRRDEKLSENVKALLKAFISDLVVVHRLLTRGVGVVLAAVEGQCVRESVRARVLLGAQEEHVLAEVRQALEGQRVLE
mmetsp:Transcript_14421/g.39616  ORF Transcript_14421/g.39616 Transcript_14421/m.39616 type:complete len:593 (-) Transcript_14421:324-2102(-)